MLDFLLIILVGLLVGGLIGMTGMGGGAIMTPFLILVMKIDPVLAIGTDLTFAAVTKWMGGLQHRRQRNVALRTVFWMALGSMPASFLMSTFVLHRWQRDSLFDRYLTLLLGLILVGISVYTMARVLNWIKVPTDIHWPPNWVLTLLGAVGGALVGLTSVGSGTIIMAALLIFFSVPPTEMVGMDVLHGALLTTVPATVYAFAGQVNWYLVGWLLLGSVPGAWLGSRFISVIPQRIVRSVLSIFLIVAGVQLLYPH